MHVRILLQITADDGAASLTEEVTALEKSAERLEDLGLSLAEGKAVTAAIQRHVVNALRGGRRPPAQQRQFASRVPHPLRRCAAREPAAAPLPVPGRGRS